MKIRFVVPGAPVPQPRPRAVLVGKGAQAKARIHELTHIGSAKEGTRRPHPIVAYRKAVAASYKATRRGELSGPLFVSCRFVFPRVDRLKGDGRHRYAVCKNDGDNLLKAVWDALNGVAWQDDGQIAEWAGDRWYAAVGEEPHTVVTIETLDPQAELF